MVMIGPASAMIDDLDETTTGMLLGEIRSELENDHRLQISQKHPQEDPGDAGPDEKDPEQETSDLLGIMPVPPKQITQTVLSNLTIIQGLVHETLSDVERGVQALKSTLVPKDSDEKETTPQSTLTEEPPAKWYQSTAVWVAAAAASSGTAALFWLAGSSAAVTPSAKKPIFSPLFTRFEGQKVLEHPRRAELYGHVAEKQAFDCKTCATKPDCPAQP